VRSPSDERPIVGRPMEQSPVKNVVGYHNADKMGYSFQDAKQPMTFLTTKSVENLVGAKVWSVAGEGHPRNTSSAAGSSSTMSVHRVMTPSVPTCEVPSGGRSGP
jgi:hypothetical protein